MNSLSKGKSVWAEYDNLTEFSVLIPEIHNRCYVSSTPHIHYHIIILALVHSQFNN